MLTVDIGLGIVEEPDFAGALGIIPIAGRHEEVDLQRPSDLAHEIAYEDERSFKQSDDEDILAGWVVLRDFLPDPTDLSVDLIG